MDLERELTRVLREVDVPSAADPVPEVLAGMHRRRRVRRLQVGTAALAVVSVAVGVTVGGPLVLSDPDRSGTRRVPGVSSTVPGPSQTAQDAARDGVVPAVAALPFAARVDLLDTSVTPEGVWAVSRMPASSGNPSSGTVGTGSNYGATFVNATEYGEVLLLDPSRTRILRAFPLPGVPPQRLLVTASAVYCERQGDGALPDSMLCRIDRGSLTWKARVFPWTSDSGFDPPPPDRYVPPNWSISAPLGEAVFQTLRLDGGSLVVSGAGGTRLVDPTTLELVGTKAGVPEPMHYGDPVPSRHVDVSWVGLHDGFALTWDSCATGPCAHLRRTTDGGRTWTLVAAKGLSPTCGSYCALHVRFANAAAGYAWVPFSGGLWTTNDGGRTWTDQGGPDTEGLEVAGGTATRVVARGGCPGCAFEVQRSDVGSARWQVVHSSSGDGYAAADLARQGDDIAVNLRHNPAGGAGDARSTLLVSLDGGTTWAEQRDPCDSTPDDEWDATQLTFSQDRKLLVLCQRRLYRSNGGNASVLVSTDGGRTFSRPTGFGQVSDVYQVAAGSGVLLAETHYGVDGELLLQRSTDGGTTWSEVARAPQPQGAVTSYLAFSTSDVVTWVPPGGSEVRRSTDAGRTWTAYPLP